MMIVPAIRLAVTTNVAIRALVFVERTQNAELLLTLCPVHVQLDTVEMHLFNASHKLNETKSLLIRVNHHLVVPMQNAFNETELDLANVSKNILETHTKAADQNVF